MKSIFLCFALLFGLDAIVSADQSTNDSKIGVYTNAGSNTHALILRGLAAEIESKINILVDFVHTTCLPAAGTISNSVDFIIVADREVLSVEKAKKAWLMVIAGAVGKELNDHPEIPGDHVFITDPVLGKERKALSIRASKIQALQRKAKNDEISLDEFYTEFTKLIEEKIMKP